MTITSATGAIIGTVIVDAAGNYGFTPTTAFADGPVTLLVTATDPAGNISPQATSSVTIDSTAS